MNRTMTFEEQCAWDLRVHELTNSDLISERIRGILMNSSIGGHGLFEDVAAIKAKTIEQMLRLYMEEIC